MGRHSAPEDDEDDPAVGSNVLLAAVDDTDRIAVVADSSDAADDGDAAADAAADTVTQQIPLIVDEVVAEPAAPVVVEPRADDDAWWAAGAAVDEAAPEDATAVGEYSDGGYPDGVYSDSGYSDGEYADGGAPYWATSAAPTVDPVTGRLVVPQPAAVDPGLAPSATADPAARFGPGAPPVKAPRAHSTGADLRLLRTHSDVRARALAGLLTPFVLYVVIMLLLGATGRQYLIWLFVPIIVAGVLVGTFLDLGHRRHGSAASPDTPQLSG